MHNGWIKLHRRIREHWLRDNAEYYSAFIDMILTVNHEEVDVLIDNEVIKCGRGQSVRSIDTWAQEFGRWWSRQKVRTFFKLLEKDSMIKVEGLRKTTRVTICNYETYQLSQPTDNQQITNTQPTDNQHLTTNKNVKNDKNVKNICSPIFEELWNKYPKRIGKKHAKRHFESTVKTDEDVKAIQIALNNYLSSERVMKGFIQNGSTWFNQWQDWVEFKEEICPKCKNKGKYISSTGYEIVCDCQRGKL